MEKPAAQKTTEQIVNAIWDLDLEPIKFKLMDSREGQGWSADAVNHYEKEYKRFLTLVVKYPEKTIAPNKTVDAFWHAHILDTMKYADDCEQVFGYFLHHYPYFGMRGDEDAARLAEAFDTMQALHEDEFGNEQPAYCGAAAAKGKNGAAYCGAFAGRRKQDAAYCGLASAQQKEGKAYCGIAVANIEEQAAYCGVASAGRKDAAYCGAASPKNAQAAYCGIASGKDRAAYCGVSSVKEKAAYCGIASPGVSAAAYCGAAVTGLKAEVSYCGAASEKGLGEVAYCGIASVRNDAQPGVSRKEAGLR